MHMMFVCTACRYVGQHFPLNCNRVSAILIVRWRAPVQSIEYTQFQYVAQSIRCADTDTTLVVRFVHCVPGVAAHNFPFCMRCVLVARANGRPLVHVTFTATARDECDFIEHTPRGQSYRVRKMEREGWSGLFRNKEHFPNEQKCALAHWKIIIAFPFVCLVLPSLCCFWFFFCLTSSMDQERVCIPFENCVAARCSKIKKTIRPSRKNETRHAEKKKT